MDFSQIPAALRLPGSYVEFDSSQAGISQIAFKRLIIGQRLAAGNVAAGVPTLVMRPDDADTYFGRGSQLAEMVKAVLAIDPWMATWAIPLDDNAAGAAATGTITVTGPATNSGTLSLYIGGKLVQVGVTANDADATIATAIAAAINAADTLPVTAAAALGVVTLTARHKGECGNDIDVRMNYNGESTPAGVGIAIVAMAGGSANPDISAAIVAMGSDWWNWIAMPYTDAPNLAALETELADRYSATRQIGGRAFAFYKDTYANTTTFGTGRNSPHVCCMGLQNSPTQPVIAAAILCARASQQLAIDPARPLQTLELTGMQAPAIADRWTDTERNLALFDGIATFKVMHDGTCRIERAITMYQTNANGTADTAYLDINTPETLERHRYNVRSEIGLRFPRSKLASDTTPVLAGDPIVRPKDIKATLVAVYQREVDLGWVEDLPTYKSTLVATINAQDPNRVDVADQPNLVNQFRVFADLVQFKL